MTFIDTVLKTWSSVISLHGKTPLTFHQNLLSFGRVKTTCPRMHCCGSYVGKLVDVSLKKKHWKAGSWYLKKKKKKTCNFYLCNGFWTYVSDTNRMFFLNVDAIKTHFIFRKKTSLRIALTAGLCRDNFACAWNSRRPFLPRVKGSLTGINSCGVWLSNISCNIL